MEKKDNRVITISNDMMTSSLVGTPAQNKLMLKVMAEVRKDDEGFEIIEFDLRNMLNSHNRREIEKFVLDLGAKRFKLDKGDSDHYVPLFGLMKVDKGSSIVQARLSEEVKPYLLGLKSHFTQYQEIEAMKTIDGTYSYKLFQLLSCKSMGGTRTEWLVTLDEFRFLMGIADGQYKQIVNLTTRVITPAVEGNLETFPGLSVEKIKRGRAIKSLKFTWENPKAHDVPNKPSKRPSSKAKQASSKPKEDSKQALTMANVNGIRERLNREAFGRHVFNDRVQRLKSVGLDSSTIFKIMCLPNSVANCISGCCPPPDNSTNPEGFVISKIKDTCDPKGIFWKGLQEMGL